LARLIDQPKEISIMKRSYTTKAFAIAAVALALSVAPAAMAANNKGCSTLILYGSFAMNGTGTIVSPAFVAGPYATVLSLTFDGYGVVTSAVGSTSQNGNIGPQTETGTYTVNPDCTGTYTVVISPGGFAAHYLFVIDSSGDELQIICTDPGVVFTGTARRQFPVGDWRN
jgi:hypothetical protein